MLSDLIEQIDSVPSQIEGSLLLPDSIVAFEIEAAKWLANEEFSIENFTQHLASLNITDLTLVNSLLQHGLQYRPSLFQRVRTRLMKKRPAIAIIRDIINCYQIDLCFYEKILLLSGNLNDLYQGKLQHPPACLHDFTWSAHKVRLANRVLLLKLANSWDEDHSDEPILWKCHVRLAKIAHTACETVLTEAVNRLLICGLANQSEQRKDSLKEFLVQGNEEKNKLLIDNLVLSKRAYDQLVDEGWQPDRWEIENLPMTVELFLDYLKKAGFSQIMNVGEEISINGEEVLHLYRYNGSPFIEKKDCKKVKVLAPGWSYRGETIIQPKVRETK